MGQFLQVYIPVKIDYLPVVLYIIIRKKSGNVLHILDFSNSDIYYRFCQNPWICPWYISIETYNYYDKILSSNKVIQFPYCVAFDLEKTDQKQARKGGRVLACCTEDSRHPASQAYTYNFLTSQSNA